MPLSRLLNWKRLRRTQEPPILRPVLASSALSVNQGGSVDVIVAVNRTRYTGTITPSITGLPSGTTGVFNPATLDSATLTTTLTLTSTGGATTVTNQAFTVTCTGSGVNNATTTGTVTVASTVTPAIALTTSKSSTTALQGQTDSFTADIVRTNYTGDVTISVTGLPSGASASVTPNPLTGGTLSAGIVITNTVGASTVTNDAYTVSGAGTGITTQNVNMQHTITAPSSSNGVPSSSFVKGNQFSYANTAALSAAILDGEGNTAKVADLLIPTGLGNRTYLTMSSDLTFEGHNVMRSEFRTDAGGNPVYLQMYFAGTSGHPTTHRAGGSNAAFTNFGAYIVVAYSSGWTPAGSQAVGAYKHSAVGLANSNGRVGVEWTGSAGTDYSYVSGPGSLTGWTGGTGATNGNTAYGRPYAINTGSGVWVVPQWVCHYWQCKALDANTLEYRHYTWLYGSAPPAGPQALTTFTGSGATLPTHNRLSLGENMNNTAAFRYMPNPSYMYWGDVRVYDLDYIDNPLNLADL